MYARVCGVVLCVHFIGLNCTQNSFDCSQPSAMKKRLHGYRGYLGIWRRSMWVSEEDDPLEEEEEEDPE